LTTIGFHRKAFNNGRGTQVWPVIEIAENFASIDVIEKIYWAADVITVTRKYHQA